jgi:hypothetical protein
VLTGLFRQLVTWLESNARTFAFIFCHENDDDDDEIQEEKFCTHVLLPSFPDIFYPIPHDASAATQSDLPSSV